MRLSARNQLAGTVSAIEDGAVMTIVKVSLAGGQEVTAVIKSTEVMLGTE